MLALGVLFLVVIDVVILVVYTAVEGSKTSLAKSTGLAAKRVVNSENLDDIIGVSKYSYNKQWAPPYPVCPLLLYCCHPIPCSERSHNIIIINVCFTVQMCALMFMYVIVRPL